MYRLDNLCQTGWLICLFFVIPTTHPPALDLLKHSPGSWQSRAIWTQSSMFCRTFCHRSKRYRPRFSCPPHFVLSSFFFFCFRMPLIFTTQGFQDSRRTDWTRWRLGCPSLGSPEPNWLHYRTRWSQSERTPWGIRPFYFFLIDLNHVWLMKNCLFCFVATMRLVCFLLTTATCFAENLRQNKFHLKWADEWSPR